MRTWHLCTPTTSHIFVFLSTAALQCSLLRNTTDYGFRHNILNDGSCVTANHILLRCLREPVFHIAIITNSYVASLNAYFPKNCRLPKRVCRLCAEWPLLLPKRLSKHRFSCAQNSGNVTLKSIILPVVWKVLETRSVMLREEYGLWMFEDRQVVGEAIST
jgi:hypothetical protein